MIRAHEYGGDDDENYVQAADSLSFLEVNVDVIPELDGCWRHKVECRRGTCQVYLDVRAYSNTQAYDLASRYTMRL